MRDYSYQVATSNDKELPLRKWNHLGSKRDFSAKSVAYQVGDGYIVKNHPGFDGGVIYEFSSGQFVSVKF